MEKDELILECIKNKSGKFKTMLKYTNLDKKELQAILTKLEDEEKIYYNHYKNEYVLTKIAKLQVKEAGYAFGIVDGENEDYFISNDDLLNAYDGDIALIYPYKQGSKLMNAKVIKIIDRAHKQVIGILHEKQTKRGIKYYVKSNSKAFDVNVVIRYENLNNAKNNQLVLCDIDYIGTSIIGKVVEIVGYPDDPGIEISQIALEYGFKSNFSDETNEEIKTIPDCVLPYQKEGRRDFTNDSVITIDGDDSKDFDDAVFVKKLSNGNFELDVHIADVASYVKENSPLDKDAFERGTSVYLADRVIPMLPRKLSNGICSLNEGVERLVLSCLMEIDLKGNLVNYEICEGVIKSHHRMTYNKVNKILNGDKDLINEYSDIYPMLLQMQQLSSIIRQRRYKKGGLEFDVDEYKITLYSDGSPKDITLRTRDDAEKLIEDFMLCANETVAYNMNIMNLPCEYRIHEKPEQEKLHDVFDIINNMGVSLKKTQNDIHPKQVQEALEKISDSPYSPILNQMLLRSMMKAKYYEKCLGHYGLAMNYYCHFTSPIRRYPDLMVHRLIKKLLLHPNDLAKDIAYYEAILPEICLKNSASERKSIECEREVDDMLYAWYMSRHIEEAFSGIITSITSFGFFVTLSNGIEGLVAYKNMDGYVIYNDKDLKCIYKDKEYKLGDKVDVVVISASKESRKIDFVLKDEYDIKGDIYEGNMQ